jgi:hypothetical protein
VTHSGQDAALVQLRAFENFVLSKAFQAISQQSYRLEVELDYDKIF